MSKLQTVQTNFTAGEVSPKLFGHTDLQRYQNGALTLENVVPLVFGGVRKRFGTSMRARAKFDDREARLIPFVVNRDLSYMCEVGDSYVRFFRRDGTPIAGYELSTFYTVDRIWDVDYVQGASEMFLAHPEVLIQRMRNFAETNWNIGTPPFTTLPFDEVGITPPYVLALSDVSVGTGRTATCGGTVFVAADVGRAILYQSGIGVVTSVIDASHVTVTINEAFPVALLPVGWNLDSSPMTTATPSAVVDVGQAVNVTFAAASLRGGEEGQYIRINDGLLRITEATSAYLAQCTVVTKLSSAVASPPLAWSLESAVWSDIFGQPRTVSIHQQRLIAAGSMKYPQTVWGSVTGEKLNFQGGTLDSDGYSFTVESDEVNPITYVASGRDLLALTFGGEFSLKGGVEKPITPTNVQIDPQSPFGSLGVRPVNVGKELMFAQRAGRKIRAMAYQYTIDGYVAPDITVLAEHITRSGIKDMAYQQEPDQVIWVVRNDGVLVSCTIDRDQDVIAWARHTTDGFFESIACIPGANGDDLWAIVRREINGITRRFVERVETSWLPYADSEKDWGFTLDCAVSYSFPLNAAQTVLDGLDHLEGKTVAAVADGASMGLFVVVNGAIELPRAAVVALVGLPFKPTIRTLRPEIQSPGGTAQSSRMRINNVVARFFETIGATVNGEKIAFRAFGSGLLDQVPVPYSGDEPVTNAGWDTGDAPVVISQDNPLPFALLSIIKSITVNTP